MSNNKERCGDGGRDVGGNRGEERHNDKTENLIVSLSKSLSNVLRHNALKEGLNLQADGYARLDELMRLPKFRNTSFEKIQLVVKENDKQRFTLIQKFENGKPVWWIRANQGHTINVKELELEKMTHPSQIPMVIHGTYLNRWDDIKSQGLSKMNRNHIHFASGRWGDVDVKSGMRKNCSLFIYVDVPKAMKDGIEFHKSVNGVILSEGDKGILDKKYFLKVIDKDENILYPEENSNRNNNKNVNVNRNVDRSNNMDANRNVDRSNNMDANRNVDRSNNKNSNKNVNNKDAVRSNSNNVAGSNYDSDFPTIGSGNNVGNNNRNVTGNNNVGRNVTGNNNVGRNVTGNNNVGNNNRNVTGNNNVGNNNRNVTGNNNAGNNNRNVTGNNNAWSNNNRNVSESNNAWSNNRNVPESNNRNVPESNNRDVSERNNRNVNNIGESNLQNANGSDNKKSGDLITPGINNIREPDTINNIPEDAVSLKKKDDHDDYYAGKNSKKSGNLITPVVNIREPDTMNNVPEGAVLLKKKDDDDYYAGKNSKKSGNLITPVVNIREPDTMNNVPEGAVLLKKKDDHDDYYAGNNKKKNKKRAKLDR